MPLDTLHQIKTDLAASGHFASPDAVDVALPNEDESHRQAVTAKVFYETIESDEEDSELGTDDIVIRIDLKDATDPIEGQSQMANGIAVKINNGAGYTSGSTDIVVDDVTGIVVGDLFETVLLEVVQVTAIDTATNTLTITRALQGSTAATIADNDDWVNLQAGTYAGFEYYFKGNRTTRGRYSYNAGGNYNVYTRVTTVGQLQDVETGSDSNDVGRYFFEVSLESFRG